MVERRSPTTYLDARRPPLPRLLPWLRWQGRVVSRPKLVLPRRLLRVELAAAAPLWQPKRKLHLLIPVLPIGLTNSSIPLGLRRHTALLLALPPRSIEEQIAELRNAEKIEAELEAMKAARQKAA